MKKILLLLVIIAVGATIGWYVLIYKNVNARNQTVNDIHDTYDYASYSFNDGFAVPSPKITSNTTFTLNGENVVLWKKTHAEMSKMLLASKTENYMYNLPKTDGWGNDYEFYVTDNAPAAYSIDDAPSGLSILMRSPGKDGVYSSNAYDVGSPKVYVYYSPYDIKTAIAVDYDKDLVLINGYWGVAAKSKAN